MPVRYEVVTGGLVAQLAGDAAPVQKPIIDYKIELPDTFGGQTLAVAGFLSPAIASGGLGPAVAITGTPALPAVPGVGGQSLNWILQVNLTTGVITAKTGAAATTGTQVTPTADAGNLTLWVHTITNGDTIPWARAPTLTDLNP